MRIVYGTTVLANPDAEQPITDYALSAQQTVSMADIAIAPYNAPDSRGNRSATLSFPAPRIFTSLADAQAYTSDLYADLPAKADLVLTYRDGRTATYPGAVWSGFTLSQRGARVTANFSFVVGPVTRTPAP